MTGRVVTTNDTSSVLPAQPDPRLCLLGLAPAPAAGHSPVTAFLLTTGPSTSPKMGLMVTVYSVPGRSPSIM